jgi:Cytochrome c7 and related cytochrome c
MRRWAALVASCALAACEDLPPPPAQPIAFNHKLHAGQNHIGCTMCHAWAEHAPVAGVPSMARCIGCHRFVDKDKPDIVALQKIVDEGRVVEWTRVHRLPDHVYFAHEPHVGRARLACQECHGAVEKMDVVRQVAPLTMGWCVECHLRRGAPLDCLGCHK